ncbi:CBS domain-containing protein [Azospirillum sp. ST 5-10]|uniref:CBS domain-containing protein n=1 Tax=unclassified Azospirillum TaxID=2630922 RepID=UPI003F49CB63
MKARDVMSTELCCVAPDTPVSEIAALLLERRISGVPVVDTAGTLVGVVSEADLMWHRETDVTRRHGWLTSLLGGARMMAADFVKAYGTRAGDVMSSPAVSVEEDAALADILALMDRRRIKRVPVVRRGRVVGMVSRSDFLRALASHRVEPPAAGDAAIRARLVELLEAQPWTSLATVNVVVQDGEVRYAGLVGSDVERTALLVAARSIPGVRDVEDDLTVRDGTAVD